MLGFLFQSRSLFLKVIGIVARPRDELPPIKIDNPSGHFLQKGAVMGDDQYGPLKLEQLIFQPEDDIQVQMVGWLVQ